MFPFGPWLWPLPQRMKRTNVTEWMRAKVSRLGREGSGTPLVGAASLLPGASSPVSPAEATGFQKSGWE